MAQIIDLAEERGKRALRKELEAQQFHVDRITAMLTVLYEAKLRYEGKRIDGAVLDAP